ncbi:hypothetical protein Emag_000391 [Eimeria magna]
MRVYLSGPGLGALLLLGGLPAAAGSVTPHPSLFLAAAAAAAAAVAAPQLAAAARGLKKSYSFPGDEGDAEYDFDYNPENASDHRGSSEGASRLSSSVRRSRMWGQRNRMHDGLASSRSRVSSRQQRRRAATVDGLLLLPGGLDASTDDESGLMRRMFSTARASLRTVSQRVYARGEDYWRDPRRRRALAYFAAVTLLLSVVAYAEHRENVVIIELEELGNRQELVKEMERDVNEEIETLQQALKAAAETADKQQQEEAALHAREDELRKKRGDLRDKMAAAQEEETALRVLEAREELTAAAEAQATERHEASVKQLEAIREEARRLLWSADVLRTGEASPALGELAIEEKDVLVKYNMVLHAMQTEPTPASERRVLQIQSELMSLMTAHQARVQRAIASLTDELWMTNAVKHLLEEPDAKPTREELEEEWEEIEKEQQEFCEGLKNQRSILNTLREDVASKRNQAEACEAVGVPLSLSLRSSIFELASRELYQEGIVKAMDHEAAAHKDKHAWVQHISALLDEADMRASELLKTWASPKAAAAEVDGRIEALIDVIDSLKSKTETCAQIQEMWQSRFFQFDTPQPPPRLRNKKKDNRFDGQKFMYFYKEDETAKTADEEQQQQQDDAKQEGQHEEERHQHQ